MTTRVTQGGLGATFVEEVAKHSPALLILAGRSPSKVQATVDKIKSNPASANVQVRILRLDLSSQQQIREAAKEVLNYPEDHIDVLVNSAAAPGGLLLQGWTAIDAQNKRTKVTLSNQRYNVAVPESAFTFKEPTKR